MKTAEAPIPSPGLPEAFHPDQGAQGGLRFDAVWAVAGVVVLELKRRKDFYVLFFLTALLTVGSASVSFFNEDKIVRYVKEISLFLIWVSTLVIAITTTGRQIPAEREHRTLFPLLAKPITRSELLLGKFTGCWMAAGLALLMFYLFFGLLNGIREGAWPLAEYFQAVTLHWFMLGVVVSMSLLGSLIFAAPSSNNTIVFVVVAGILLLGRHLNKVAQQAAEPVQTILSLVYFVMPHLEFYDMRDLLVHNHGTVPWLAWVGALGYAAVFMGVFLFMACFRFRRRTIST